MQQTNILALQVCLFVFNISLKAQSTNLVTDHSFECFSYALNGITNPPCSLIYNSTEIDRISMYAPCLPWFGNSVDLISACIKWQGLPLISNYQPCNGLAGCSTVPQNYGGWQYPHSGNNYLHLAYSSLSFMVDTLGREHANTPISLEANKEYCAGFYAVLADTSNMFSYGPGLKFYNQDPYINGPTIHDYNPNVWGNFYMDDSVNWRKVSGKYTATGQEQYLTIGNFWTASAQNNPKAPVSNMIAGLGICRIYIDDVFVTELGNVSAGSNKEICVGDSVLLGSAEIPGADYTWYPVEGLSNIHAAQPKAAPNQTTTYHLIMDQCRILYDSVRVLVRKSEFAKEISACKGERVTIAAKTNSYANESSLEFLPEGIFSNVYADSAILNIEQNTKITVVQKFENNCQEIKSEIEINVVDCSVPPICKGYANGNGILQTSWQTKELTVYSLDGGVVFYVKNYTNNFDCNNLSSGIYILKQRFDDGTEKVCKLVWVKG